MERHPQLSLLSSLANTEMLKKRGGILGNEVRITMWASVIKEPSTVRRPTSPRVKVAFSVLTLTETVDASIGPQTSRSAIIASMQQGTT